MVTHHHLHLDDTLDGRGRAYAIGGATEALLQMRLGLSLMPWMAEARHALRAGSGVPRPRDPHVAFGVDTEFPPLSLGVALGGCL